MFRSLYAQRAKRTILLREQGVAGSNPVIPTILYKERPSRGRSFLLSSGPYPGRINLQSDNLSVQRMMSCVFRGGGWSPGHVWGDGTF